jgi:hypothetical protein
VASCGSELRQIGLDALSMEQAARRIVRYLRERFVNPSTARRSFVLARFFTSVPYSRLDAGLQVHAQSVLRNARPSDDMCCLTLLASAGSQPEWNSRLNSRRHRVIPIPSADTIAKAPMLSQLFAQFGLDPRAFVSPDPDLMVVREQTSYNVFHVPDARSSTHVPDQDGFVVPHEIRSVLGFGGLLPPADLFAVIVFARDPMARATADMFKPLALSAKIAVLPFVPDRLFD